MQSLSVVDATASEVNDNKVLVHALANVAHSEKEHGWAVRQGDDFINEYPHVNENGLHYKGTTDDLNHLLGSFPCLFPYNQGGFKIDRPKSVFYDVHTCWALCYANK